MATQSEEKENGQERHDREYFESYGDLGVHELMLRDRPRTQCYQEVIRANSSYIRGKVVVCIPVPLISFLSR